MSSGGADPTLRAALRVRPDPTSSDDEDSVDISELIEQSNAMAEVLHRQLQTPPNSSPSEPNPIYDYLSLISAPDFHPHLSRLDPQHFSLLTAIFTCARLPMMFSLVLRAILSFLEFIDPLVIAESVNVIVRTCLSVGQDLFTVSRVVGLTSLFAILSQSVQICGLEVLPLEFIGFAACCLSLPADDKCIELFRQIAAFLLSVVDCDEFPQGEVEAIAMFTWQIVAKLADCDALPNSTDLLFSIYSHFDFPFETEFSENVYHNFAFLALADLTNAVHDETLLLRGLRVFHFLFVNSHCSPLLADGYALKQVCDSAFTTGQCFEVRHLSQRVFCDAVKMFLPELLAVNDAVMRDDAVLQLTCQAFTEMADSSDDRETMVVVGEALGELSLHFMRSGQAVLLWETLSAFEVPEALVQWGELEDPTISELVDALSEVYAPLQEMDDQTVSRNA
jgi:hypothetical protein